MVKSTNSEAGMLRFTSRLSLLATMNTYRSLSSLSLNFSICKMENIMILASRMFRA